MCRKTYLHGCCLACLGFGILIGFCLERWISCLFAGLGLVILGFSVMRRNS